MKLYALINNRYDVYNRSWMQQLGNETREKFIARVRAAYPIDNLDHQVEFIEGEQFSE